MALTKKQKITIRDVCKFLTVAEMSVRLGVSEKDIYDYLKVIKVKPVVSSGLIDNKDKNAAIKSINISKTKETIEDKKLSFFGIIKNNWKFLLLLSIGVFLIYLNSLKGDFVSDDYARISQNPTILNIVQSYKEGSLVDLTNSIIANVFGLKSSFPFHLFSLILYIGVCIAVFVFLSLIFEKNVAIFSTILFASLPIHVESISWISGKPYIMSALLILISLSLTLLLIKTQKKKYWWFLLPFLALTFLSDKVRSTSYFLILILYVITYREELKEKVNLKKFLGIGALCLIVLFIVLIPMIKYRVSTVNGGYNFVNSYFNDPLYQYPTSIAKYLQLLFLPIDLTLYHTMYVIPVWLNWVILITYLVSLVYFFFKNKNLFFALAFIFIATASSMAPVKVSWIVAERYMFLGSIGFALFLVLAFKPLSSKLKLMLPLLFATITIIYGVRVICRNTDWKTNHNLWVNTVQVSPNSHNAWNNIGDDYDKLGDLENAVKGFTQSTVVKENYADAYHNRANIYYKAGRYDLARDSYETALKYSPELYQTYISLVQVDFVEQKADLALEHSKKLVDIQPYNPQSYYVLGIVYAQLGMNEEAKTTLNKALSINPNYKAAKDLLIQIK